MGTQSSQSSTNSKDRNLLPLWDGSAGVEQPDSSSTRPACTHLMLLIQRWTQQGSEEAAPSPGSRVTTDSVSKAKMTQRATTKERGCCEGGRGGVSDTHRGVPPGKAVSGSHRHTRTRRHSAGPVHVSGAISLRKQKRLSILFLNHIFQDQNLISQALLLKAKVKTTNNTSILPALGFYLT